MMSTQARIGEHLSGGWFNESKQVALINSAELRIERKGSAQSGNQIVTAG